MTRRCIPPAAAMLLLCVSFLSPPAQGLITGENMFDVIPCVAEGNESQASAAWIEHAWMEYNCVCEGDLFDWYAFAGPGEIDWRGVLWVFTDKPGLAVRLYFDNGSGLNVIREAGPTYIPEINRYILEFLIDEDCLNAGFPSPLNGYFYLRVFYYSAFPGEHPYIMMFNMRPEPSVPGDANSPAQAHPLPIDTVHHGTLNPSDAADWYYWDHPASEPVDGFIEGIYLANSGFGALPPLQVSLHDSNGEQVTYAILDEKKTYCTIDLAWQNIAPARYYIKVYLAEEYPFQIMYQIRNRATLGPADGYLSDANDDPICTTTLYPDIPLASSLCRPRDREDHYIYNSDTYFIGDITVNPIEQSGLYGPEVSYGDKRVFASLDIHHGASFYDNPIPPGALKVTMYDITPAARIHAYEIIIEPDGGGPYNAPGHSSWESARPILDERKYSFELEPGLQDRFCFSASTGPSRYLSGFMEIYGSQPDYEVRVGALTGQGAVWGQAIAPGGDGRAALDFAYEILVEPGDYILRIKLNDGVTGRRRFYINQALTIEECWQEGADTISEPGTRAWSAGGGRWEMKGILCPPDDATDYGRFKVDEDFYVGVPSTFKMTVRAGYPGMRFRLYDSSHNLLWETQIDELGGSETVFLSTLVNLHEEYVVEASIDTDAERVMVWRADFEPAPTLLIDPGMLKAIKPESTLIPWEPSRGIHVIERNED